jgi:hypothetical protein
MEQRRMGKEVVEEKSKSSNNITVSLSSDNCIIRKTFARIPTLLWV